VVVAKGVSQKYKTYKKKTYKKKSFVCVRPRRNETP
jgi:hypothetical protein